MYRLSADLSSHTLSAGEPLILEVQLLKSNGQATDIDDTSLVFSVYKPDRTVVDQVLGERATDAQGNELFRWAFEGTWSENLYGELGLRIEIARRWKNGREKIADGALTIAPSAKTVPSLSTAAIGELAQRATLKANAVLGGPPSVTIEAVLVSNAVLPPSFSVDPSISHDGTPVVGETLTGNSGTIVGGTVTSMAWLLGGTAITGATGGTYVPMVPGQYSFHVDAGGDGGSTSATSSSVTVGAGPVAYPSDVSYRWTPSSLSLANGAAVTQMVDAKTGIVATQTGDSTSPHTFVADSGGGVPGVAFSGAAVLSTTGSNAAAAALKSGTFSFWVVVRDVKAPLGGNNGGLAAAGSGGGLLLQATPTVSGRYQFELADTQTGIRMIAFVSSAAAGLGYTFASGTAIQTLNAAAEGEGQFTLGGWQNASSTWVGRATLLDAGVDTSARSIAYLTQIFRHFVERAGSTVPASQLADLEKDVLIYGGDSLTAGESGGPLGSHGFRAKQALNLPLGRWILMGRSGADWFGMKDAALPLIGNLSAVRGGKKVLCVFEQANMRGLATAAVIDAAKGFITAARSLDAQVKIVFGTSTDFGGSWITGSDQLDKKDAYNAYWDVAGNRTGWMNAYVPLHLNTTIGVRGAAVSGNGAFADSLHWLAPGHQAAADTFLPAVQTLLAA